MTIFANHAHVFPEAIRPEGTIDELLKLMDACGIERAVAFAPFRRQWGDRHGSPVEWLAGAIELHRDRLVGYAALNPERADAVDDLLRARDRGMPGVKMHPAFEEWRVTSPAAMTFYGAAAELGMILDFHTGIHMHRLSDYDPLLFDEVACDFPGLTMVFEHVGGWHFHKQMIAVIVNHMNEDPPRLYGGIASSLHRGPQRFWYLGPQGLRDTIWQIGHEHVIFGLDFPYNGVKETTEDLETIRGMGLKPAVESALLGGNLARLLGT